MKKRGIIVNTELNIVNFEDNDLRTELLNLSNRSSRKILTIWAFEISKHAYEICKIKYEHIPFIIEGYLTLTLWLDNKAKISDLRREFFQIEKFRRMYNKSAVVERALAQSAACAVGAPSVLGKSLASSDYAIQAIWEYSNHDASAIKEERLYQLAKLKELS